MFYDDDAVWYLIKNIQNERTGLFRMEADGCFDFVVSRMVLRGEKLTD